MSVRYCIDPVVSKFVDRIAAVGEFPKRTLIDFKEGRTNQSIQVAVDRFQHIKLNWPQLDDWGRSWLRQFVVTLESDSALLCYWAIEHLL